MTPDDLTNGELAELLIESSYEPEACAVAARRLRWAAARLALADAVIKEAYATSEFKVDGETIWMEGCPVQSAERPLLTQYLENHQ